MTETERKYRLALLHIGSQHPAWSADPNSILVKLFNRVVADARKAVGAVGEDEDTQADWCADEVDRMEGREVEVLNDD